jgi:riboflavin synthase
MFTGLIETTGTLLAITPTEGATRITIAAPTLTARLNTGDSVAVNGVCLTALSIEPDAILNLELPTPAGSPLGGHVVQGHVDGTAMLLALEPITPTAPETDWRLRIQLPDALTRYVVAQGSITIEGISLTVASILGNEVEVAIIPHTYAVTSLRTLTPGSLLNIEVDVLSKYAERRQNPSEKFHLTEEYLIANGY